MQLEILLVGAKWVTGALAHDKHRRSEFPVAPFTSGCYHRPMKTNAALVALLLQVRRMIDRPGGTP